MNGKIIWWIIVIAMGAYIIWEFYENESENKNTQTNTR